MIAWLDSCYSCLYYVHTTLGWDNFSVLDRWLESPCGQQHVLHSTTILLWRISLLFQPIQKISLWWVTVMMMYQLFLIAWNIIIWQYLNRLSPRDQRIAFGWPNQVLRHLLHSRCWLVLSYPILSYPIRSRLIAMPFGVLSSDRLFQIPPASTSSPSNERPF